MKPITRTDMARTVSGLAAIAEHDAGVLAKRGLHGEQLESYQRYAATLRAAANLFKSTDIGVDIEDKPLIDVTHDDSTPTF